MHSASVISITFFCNAVGFQLSFYNARPAQFCSICSSI